jgi:hypothetical protein
MNIVENLDAFNFDLAQTLIHGIPRTSRGEWVVVSGAGRGIDRHRGQPPGHWAGRASAGFGSSSAGGATGDRRSWSALRSRLHVAVATDGAVRNRLPPGTVAKVYRDTFARNIVLQFAALNTGNSYCTSH